MIRRHPVDLIDQKKKKEVRTMRHPTLKLLFTLALTLCALALCGCVMAESVRYSINIA